MTKKLLTTILFISFYGYSQQEPLKNYSIDASYGYTGFIDSHNDQQNIIALGHFDVGIKYMKGKTWGAKIDFGKDKTMVTVNGITSGCDYTRISLQTVCDLRHLLHTDIRTEYSPKTTLLSHFGGGYSYQTSNIIDGTDHIGNIIFGIKPNCQITKNINLGIDLTGIINLSRHFNFDGKKIYNGSSISETGFMYNASISLSYTFWREVHQIINF